MSKNAPWRVDENGCTVRFSDHWIDAINVGTPDRAELIVNCVNSHDELTTALASERMHKGDLISRIAELEKALERARAGFECVNAMDGEDLATYGHDHCDHEIAAIESALKVKS